MITARKGSALAASGAVTLLLGGLWLGSGVATAGDAPLPNTPECTALVEADVSVKAAVDAQAKAATALNALPATDPGFEAAQTLVVSAGAKLDDVRAKAQVRLCTGTVETTEPTTEPTPTTTEPTTTAPTTSRPADPTTIVVVPPRCTDRRDYAHDPRSNAVINSIGEDTGRCPDPIDGTRDNGSVADTNGSQVRVVPEGSVNTGDGSTEPGMS